MLTSKIERSESEQSKSFRFKLLLKSIYETVPEKSNDTNFVLFFTSKACNGLFVRYNDSSSKFSLTSNDSNSLLKQLTNVRDLFDQNENEYFQKSEEDSPEENYQKELDNFFNDEINKYIYSDIMNVEKEKFIDKSLLRPYISCLDL